MIKVPRIFIYLIIICLTTPCLSQSPMQEGFGYLEKGDFEKGKQFFENFLKSNPKNTTAKLCYGRAVGLSGDPQRAKVIFQELLDLDPDNIEFNINGAECLLWNKEFEVALKRYLSLRKKFKPNPIIELGLANTYSNLKQYKKAIHHYHQGLALNDKVVGIYIGLAYTHVANNQNKEALKTIDKALTVDPNQAQLKGLQKDILNKLRPLLKQRNSITSDSGDNQSIISNTELIYPLSTTLTLGAFYKYRESSNLINKEKSKQYELGVTASYNLTNKITLEAILAQLDIKGGNSYQDITYRFGAKFKLAYNQDLNIYYHKEYHNFNVALINNKISQEHLFGNYHILTSWDIGLFTQFYHTRQSDGNSRNLLFTSLYYLLKKSPPIKVGLNSVIMGFEKERSAVYFSPEEYYVFEAFLDLSLFKHTDKWIAKANAAYGYQIINTASQQSFRAEATVGYKPSAQLKAELFGQYSNQAVGNASGFEFNEFGIRVNYRF